MCFWSLVLPQFLVALWKWNQRLPPLWYICTSLAYCSHTGTRRNETQTHTFRGTHPNFKIKTVSDIGTIRRENGCHRKAELVIFSSCRDPTRCDPADLCVRVHPRVMQCHRRVTQMSGISAMSPDTLTADPHIMHSHCHSHSPFMQRKERGRGAFLIRGLFPLFSLSLSLSLLFFASTPPLYISFGFHLAMSPSTLIYGTCNRSCIALFFSSAILNCQYF